MGKLRRNKEIWIIVTAGFVVVTFIFCKIWVSKNRAQADEGANIEITANETWPKDRKDLVFDRPVYIKNGAIITVEKGTVVKFKKSSDDYRPSGIYVLNGSLIVNGTQDEPAVFTSDEEESGFMIDLYSSSDQDSFLRYAEISKGGSDFTGTYTFNMPEFLVKTAYAYYNGLDGYNDGYAALRIESGKTYIENSYFHDNHFLDVTIWDGEKYDEDFNDLGEQYDTKAEIVNSNFSGPEEAIFADVCYSAETEDEYYACLKESALLKNNWYGDPGGPTEEKDADFPKGAGLYGGYYLDGYRETDLVIDPVVVIPGILGSQPKFMVKGEMVLDPILHVYDNLIASFKKNGYKEDKNLFEFPYEWRNSNIQTAEALKSRIQETKDETGISKVDIVAHSMGGLVARYYIESALYQDDVDQLITLGTPHSGSPEAYLKWEAGEGFEDPLDKLVKKMFQLEAFHATGSTDLKDYIQSNVKSVGELLPDYDYLYDVEKSELREYPDAYPKNILLDFLNKDEYLDNLKKVDFINIVGKVSGDKTISKFRVVESDRDGLWEHGMPENFYDTSTDQGIEYGSGDETVPLRSAEGIASDKEIELGSAHTDLPTEAQCYVMNELTARAVCEPVSTWKRIKSFLTFGVFSPVDVQIITPSGKKLGKDFDDGGMLNEIPGAYYSGYDTENEFLTIPDPEAGKYTILSEGTGSGEYKIEMTKITENDDGSADAASASVTGLSENGGRYENIIDTADLVAESNPETPKSKSTVVSVASSNDGTEDDDGSSDHKHKKRNSGSKPSSSAVLADSSALSEESRLAMDTQLYPNQNILPNREKEPKNEDVAGAASDQSPLKKKGRSAVYSIVTFLILLSGGIFFYLKKKAWLKNLF